MTVDIRGKEIHYKGRSGFWNLAANDLWEKESFDVLHKFIERGKVFIDIGAWIGTLSIYASKLGAKVWAIEPDHIAYEELRMNIELNGNDIKHFRIAIANENGFVYLNSMTKNGFGNSESSLIERKVVESKESVIAETLETFLRKEGINKDDICLIKIDIEGGEILVIEQSKEFLQKHKPKIYISFHPAWFPDLQKNIAMFIDVLFPVYDIISTKNYNAYSEQQFKAALSDCCDHSFILIPKQ